MSGTLPSLTVDGSVATLQLERPEQANRLGDADLACLLEHFQRIEADPAIRVVVLRARGKHFCAGYHLGDLESGAGGDAFEAVAQALEALRPVTIAAVQGGAYGGASDLLLACDFRVGGPAAEVMMPAARFGLHLYGSLLERYVSRLGLNVAKRLILVGDRLASREMFEVGFLTHRVEDATALEAEVRALSERVAGMAPLAVGAMKRHLNAIARDALDRRALAEDIRHCADSADLAEGLQALKERRRAVFRGR
ncbi:enoyl-CoA hydratase/isomerase family protein [Halomonas cerina]|uniref:Enoyl-CoA hydratase/carnithine racemase n=1 Tax=Halomonas cerina TaxID=447424 RepID=A0A839VD28_9GAMM|nr:enoyl-CoA hydratase/isomerase family protein [Halomonas cerina]MBB3191935.1 enoyl-CoA hydratase/carnithine racemase [Halomonas cerina]